MLKAEKKTQVAELSQALQKVPLAVLTGFQGLNVAQMTDLRVRLRKSGAKIKVVKNRLAKISAKGTSLEPVIDHFKGPIGLVLAGDDAAKAAKALVEFAKDAQAFQIKVGVLEKEVLDAAGIAKLATLPSREELLSKLLGLFNAPAQNFVSLLAAVPRNFVTLLKAYHDKQQEAA